MAHRCEDCGEEFSTLSKLRLHECEEERKKASDRVEFERFATHEDGTPVAMFTVNLERGVDLGTKFDLAFAAVDEGGDEKFAFVAGDHQPIATLDYDENVAEFLDGCLEHEEYITAINYENTEFDLPDGRDAGFIITGRRLGAMFDHTERESLPPQMLETIRSIKRTLDRSSRTDRDGEVELQHIDESESVPPLRDSPGATVLELAVTSPPGEGPTVRIAEQQGGLGGDFNRLILVAGAPSPPTDRPIAVEPFPEAQASRYLRLTFDYEQRKEAATMYTRAVNSGEVRLESLLGREMAASLLDPSLWRS